MLAGPGAGLGGENRYCRVEGGQVETLADAEMGPPRAHHTLADELASVPLLIQHSVPSHC